MSIRQALDNYQALTSKVEAKFEEIRERHESSFACRKSCHGCCLPGLTVSAIEREAINEYLTSNPKALASAKNVSTTKPHSGRRCEFLDTEGGCTVYEVRPLVCRSHGAPIHMRDADDAPRRDVCPLNFTTESIDALPNESFINIDTVNSILAVINMQYLGATSESTRRHPLTLDGVLETGKEPESKS